MWAATWANIINIGIAMYLQGFSIGARERKFFLYSLVFLILGWAACIINLADPEIRYGLSHDVTPPMLVIGIIIAIGLTTITFLSGYLSGVCYRKCKSKSVERGK
jgi:hypothetical protein